MSLQWTIIAAFLYAEIAVVLLLLLPFISPRAWSRIFKSRFFKSIGAQSHIYFTVMIVILFLFFLDSIREMRKYGTLREQEMDHAHLDAEMQHSMKMFRAQRNFYIAGFSLFLWLVIRRLVTLICAQATLLANNEASMKQAQAATAAAQKLMNENKKATTSTGESAENEGNVKKEVYESEINELKAELEDKSRALQYAITDRDTLKSQAESLNREYDRLVEEHAKLQTQLEMSSGSLGKKDD